MTEGQHENHNPEITSSENSSDTIPGIIYKTRISIGTIGPDIVSKRKYC